MRTLLVASCAALLLLAGCAGTTTTTSGNGTTTLSATLPAKPQVLSDDGTVTAGIGARVSFTLGAPGVTPGVQGNATLLYVEMAWAGPTDLDLCVHTPSSGMTGTAQNCDGKGGGGLPGMPDSPIRLTYTAPEKGAWSVAPTVNGAAAQTDYRLRVTLFHGETTVPAGYTAL
ncbi:MAG TPA: hypothetical protein VM241_01645 [Candidatus Thermoplasmatota archaeon]|nr:hypothetical protein [Candidatus Thermoplasmatota archaeon]